MKEKDSDSDSEKDSDMAKLIDKKPHQINNNNNKEEKKELIKEEKIKENNESKEVENKKENKDENKKEELLKKKKFFSYDKIGNTYIFLVDKNNNPLITIGPHWIMFLICFLFVTAGFLFLFIYYFKFLNNFLFIPGILIYLIFCYTYIYILVTDPGIPKKINDDIANKTKNKYIYCIICKNWVTIESKTRHCSQCNVCVEGQDHHCSWTSKCIGKNNLYHFYFLISWLIVIIIYYTVAFLIAHDNWYKYKKTHKKRINNS